MKIGYRKIYIICSIWILIQINIIILDIVKQNIHQYKIPQAATQAQAATQKQKNQMY